MFRWGRKRGRRLRRRPSSVTKHYIEHKEQARELVLARLEHFNQHYNLHWNRVAIRNQRRCWGSCSSLKNLNFNYKILFLPPHLQDYIIVHELCHLVHLNHGKEFWELVAEKIPTYKECVAELCQIDQISTNIKALEQLRVTAPQSIDCV
jgi:predicted metal-dependent hydrolase